MKKKQLGINLSDLLGYDYDDISSDKKINEKNVIKILLEEIIPNKNQPRKYFKESAIKELASSIEKNGVLHPILVKFKEGKYHIISGERRYRASKIAGLKEIDCIVQEVDNDTHFIHSIIENVQREDLNPAEEALCYKYLIEDKKMTHDEVANAVSKSRSHISNLLRVLKLPDEIIQEILNENLSLGHAKVLLTLESNEEMLEYANKVKESKMSVRSLEKDIKKLGTKIINNSYQQESSSVKADFNLDENSEEISDFITKKSQSSQNQVQKTNKTQDSIDSFDVIKAMYSSLSQENNFDPIKEYELKEKLQSIEEIIKNSTGFKVKITPNKQNGGTIAIEYSSADELSEALEKLCVKIK